MQNPSTTNTHRIGGKPMRITKLLQMRLPVLAGDAIPCNVNKPVVNGSAKFNDRFSVYENSEVGIAQPTLVQVILAA
jgi:hypothetical protein